MKSYLSKFLDDGTMTHVCRCGGMFILANEEYEEFKVMVTDDSKASKITCGLEKDNCQCHEIVEVECETCSLIIGVKVVATI